MSQYRRHQTHNHTSAEVEGRENIFQTTNNILAGSTNTNEGRKENSANTSLDISTKDIMDKIR